ncbi:HEC/Ndc80p family-domain-containing protein [Globomyces pollinis-pini]|nr:HEC/Ndc80p family-domain-containing protein [Globomyces pollinis-pini]
MERYSMLPTNTHRTSKVSDAMNNLRLDNRRSTINTRTSSGRTSLYGRQSISMGNNSIMKDPRPIKEKRWQTAAIQKLVSFLINSGYPHPVAPKTLASPSSKDFQQIFKFLYSHLDPYFEFLKKFEEEVPVILKSLRYPFADQITKANLFTVGSLHAWPTLLAMLIWMVELILCVEQLGDDGDIDESLTDPEKAEKQFFDYLSKSYAVWLAGASDFEEIDTVLTEQFAEKDEKIKKSLKKVSNDYSILFAEYEKLTQNESPLTQFERQHSILESDRDKYKTYIEHIEVKRQKLQESLLSLTQESTNSEEMVKKLTEERIALTSQVENQELSPSDVDRMIAERDQLKKTLELTGSQLDSSNKAVWNKEIAVQKQMDILERRVQRYNTLLYELDLLENDNPKYQHLSKELEIFMHQTKPESMVSVNLRKEAKPAIHSLIEDFKTSSFKLSDEKLGLQEQIDNLNWKIVKKEEEVGTTESQIQILNQRYCQDKEQIGQVLQSSASEIAKLERQCHDMKMEAKQIQNASQTRLTKIQKEYEEQVRKSTQEREALMCEVVGALSTSFNFQQGISQSLDDLLHIAKENLDSVMHESP